MCWNQCTRAMRVARLCVHARHETRERLAFVSTAQLHGVRAVMLQHSCSLAYVRMCMLRALGIAGSSATCPHASSRDPCLHPRPRRCRIRLSSIHLNLTNRTAHRSALRRCMLSPRDRTCGASFTLTFELSMGLHASSLLSVSQCGLAAAVTLRRAASACDGREVVALSVRAADGILSVVVPATPVAVSVTGQLGAVTMSMTLSLTGLVPADAEDSLLLGVSDLAAGVWACSRHAF